MSGPIVHGGGVTAAAKMFGGEPKDWLDLSTGINPVPADLPAIPLSAWHRLPDQSLVEQAREAARSCYRSGHCLPLPVPGTQAAIQILPRLVPADRRIAILGPTYGEYARVFAAAGFAIDEIAELDEVGEAHGAVIIVNPNNPTGRLFEPSQLQKLHADLASREGVLVVDEAFGDIMPEASLAPFISEMPRLLLFRSFGKFFGLAGLRLGFVIGAQPWLERIEEALGPWPVSGPALVLAASLMSGDTQTIRDGIRERHETLLSILERARLKAIGGAALFTLIETARAEALYLHLARHHILVRRFDIRPQWLRFGLPADQRTCQRLSRALSEFER